MSRRNELAHARNILTAVARATLQLAAASVIVGTVIASLPLALLSLR